MRNKKYGSLATQFKSLLAHPNEIWDVYEVYKHKFPSSLACKKYCGVIITGSEATAHDRNHSDWKWIQQTRDLCQSFYDRRVPIIGYCFGHQMLAGLFGGESGRAKGWELGVKQLKSTAEFDSWKKSIHIPQVEIPPIVLQLHRDQVTKLPPNATLLGSSSKCNVEVFAIHDRVLGIQGHPEFSLQYFQPLVQDIFVSTGVFTEEEVTASLQDTSSSAISRHILKWKEFARKFLFHTDDTLVERVLQFWFNLSDQQWFNNDAMFDEQIREMFETNVIRASNLMYSQWTSTLKNDLFSRNIYRNRAEAFSQDKLALQICRSGIKREYLPRFSDVARQFFLMPLMHDEQMESQNLLARLLREYNMENTWALQHRNIIERFGRFPHRNKILGRESTTDELEFLKTHSGF